MPKATGTNVLIRILASGGMYLIPDFPMQSTADMLLPVCRSDRSLLTLEKQADWFQTKWTLGHEGCGRIAEFGPDVPEDTTFKVVSWHYRFNFRFFQPTQPLTTNQGDIVALHSVPGCGGSDCTECSRDLPQICEHGHHSGIGQDGYYTSYAAIDIRGLVLVPEGVTPAEAAVATDAVNTAYHAIHRRAEVKASETVFLFGLGGLGFNALQVIHNIGARVIISDIRQQRLDEAVRLGIPEADIVPVGKSPVEFVKERGLLIDTVADFVGTHQTFDDAQDIGMLLLSVPYQPCVDVLTRCDSTPRRKASLCWEYQCREYGPHEDGDEEEAELHFQLRRPGWGLEGGSGPDFERCHSSSSTTREAGGLSEVVEGFGGWEG